MAEELKTTEFNSIEDTLLALHGHAMDKDPKVAMTGRLTQAILPAAIEAIKAEMERIHPRDYNNLPDMLSGISSAVTLSQAMVTANMLIEAVGLEACKMTKDIHSDLLSKAFKSVFDGDISND